MSVMGGAAFATLAGWSCRHNNAKVSSLPVDAAQREHYARQLLDQLCTQIGPRPTGSPAYKLGAQLIFDELKKSLPSVSFDNYLFDKWELDGIPTLFVGDRQLETYLAVGSKGTPSVGLTGFVEQMGDMFFLIANDPSRRVIAHIAVNKYGKAIPLDHSLADRFAPPACCVGKQDAVCLQEAERNRTRVRLSATVRYSANGEGINVVGQLPGQSSDEVLILAHADTMYNTPGAIDNTASLITMVMLAHEAAKRGNNRHTMTFVATDGEEFGYLGAKHYAGARTEDDSMKHIRYVINFDSLTWGPNLWINSLNDEVKDIIRTIHDDLGIKAYPRFESKDGFFMDSEPFRASEGRGLHVNSRGYDKRTLPLYHRPDDSAENVPMDCVEIGFQVFNEFLQRIDHR